MHARLMNGMDEAGGSDPHDDEVTEVQLLIPRSQLHGLEDRARREGLTVAHLIRRVLAIYMTTDLPSGSSPSAPSAADRGASVGPLDRP